MLEHATHEMTEKGCLGCGVPPAHELVVDPCPNSRCPRCHEMVGICRCMEIGPRVGEEFVYLSAEPGSWEEDTDTIADVLHRDGAVWIVEVGHAGRERVPEVFVERFGPKFGRAHLTRHGVVFYDGRWYHEREAEEVRARRFHSPARDGEGRGEG